MKKEDNADQNDSYRAGSEDIFTGFCWHSSIGIDSTLEGNKRFVTKIPVSREAMSSFIVVGNNHLIHKSTKCLWKFSEDKKSIIPEFDSDVLSLDEIK